MMEKNKTDTFAVRLIVWRRQLKCLMKTKHTHDK